MTTRFIACASALAVIMSTSAALADDVGLSAAERAKNIKAYEARKAQGLATDTPRGGRSAGQQSQRAQKQNPQQQAMERAKRCQDAVNDAQNTAVGTSVLSSAVGFLPFGGAASGVASAAAGVGASAAGEIARQKAAASVQGNCGG
ncbi:MAG: hypothetical protein ACRC9K_19035 [Afipia sp.]